MERCLFCYKELTADEQDFHPKCAKKIFDTTDVPLLMYSKDNVADLAEQIIRSHSAVTGVQAKLSLDIEKRENGEPQRFTIVGLWGRFILKPQTKQFRSLPELEDLTMHLAEIAKVATVPHSLIRFEDGELAYITKRIDRNKKGDKFAMEDMCQLTERLTEYKYKGSYEQISKMIDKYSSAPNLDKINFWEQVIFSWITGNADMHLKNFSLYAKKQGVYQLTPAYDMLSTVLVTPEDPEELALTLNGKKRKIKRTDFELAMTSCGIDNKVIENIFNKFAKALPKWEEMISISFLPDDLKEEYILLLRAKIARLM